MTPINRTDDEANSANMIAQNIEVLKGLFPEAVSEGKLDLTVLKGLIGTTLLPDEERDEKYGINWFGKRKARQIALTPSTGTLRPCKEDSVDWDTTKNLMIEGDNLEVLKLLQKSYSGKVKLIYIDPPYNTGKDFVYPDNFQDNISNYLELTGQIEGGAKLQANTEASGRFHTDWLNMMYPRLKLAKNLLRDDGVIFISVDDNEADRLRLLCDEIFGEENYLVTLYIQVRYAEKTLAEKNDYQKLIEQVLVYQKWQFSPIKEEEEYTTDKFIWRVIEKGKGQKTVFGGRNTTIFKSGEYEIVQEKASVDLLKETWATGTVLKANASGKFFNDYIASRKSIDGLGCLYKVEGIGDDGIGYRYFSGPKREDATKGKFYSGVPNDRRVQLANGTAVKYKPIPNFLDMSDSFGNCRQEGNVDFGSGKKPIAFLNKIMGSASNPQTGDIVCDFFAGSGSLGHAVYESNQKDEGNRRFILVQLPEKIENNEFPNIAEMTKARLRRSGKKLKENNPMFRGDLGFRVFKLDTSNILPWEPEWDQLELIVKKSVDHIKEGRAETDILYELLLKLGLDLAVPIEQKEIESKTVYSIGAGTLIVCLDKKIGRSDAEPLALGIVGWHKELAPVGETTCVFLDSGFVDDVAKTNLSAILNQYGLANVRSL